MYNKKLIKSARLLILIAATFLINNITVAQNYVIIDFETIPNGTPSDNLKITDQFLSLYGISFSLGDGSPATLAEVGGSQATAFVYAAGNYGRKLYDTPAPKRNRCWPILFN